MLLPIIRVLDDLQICLYCAKCGLLWVDLADLRRPNLLISTLVCIYVKALIHFIFLSNRHIHIINPQLRILLVGNWRRNVVEASGHERVSDKVGAVDSAVLFFSTLLAHLILQNVVKGTDYLHWFPSVYLHAHLFFFVSGVDWLVSCLEQLIPNHLAG